MWVEKVKMLVTGDHSSSGGHRCLTDCHLTARTPRVGRDLQRGAVGNHTEGGGMGNTRTSPFEPIDVKVKHIRQESARHGMIWNECGKWKQESKWNRFERS